jgi:sialate O-acetylesterase
MHAVPYFFAKKLLENENTPIGLINIAVGGTSAEAWLPEEIIQQSFPGLHKKLAPLKIPGRVAQTEKDDAERASKWNENLEMNDTGLTEQWYSVDYNDGGWDERMLLDNNGLPPHGAVWYRKSVVLDDGAGPFTLSLGRITDSVRVYINGQPIITVDYQYPPCICGIPDGILRPGENIIAVRVVGNSNNPAFIPGKRYELKTANQSVDLTGPWKYKAGTVLPRLEPGTWFYDYPCAVYNAMLAPFLGYGVDGVIWYQGESNTKEPDDYGVLFASFINYIRERFGENLPFIYTQLANYADTTGISGKIWKNWAVVREHQRKTLAIPNTAMAVTIDCGEWNDIHPVDKKTVGERLGLCARRLVYKEDIQSEGPAVTGADVNGGTLTINFNHAKGLWAKDGRPMLDVVDTNGNTHRIYAEIQGEALMAKINEIQAERIRFGWLDCPVVTLYNAYGLPASPFEAEVNSAGK